MGRKAMRWLMGFGPPLTWLAILCSDAVASGIRGPVLVYGLAALATVPGLIGLSMLPVRGRAKSLIAPFYLIGVVFVLLYIQLVFVCVSTQDCP